MSDIRILSIDENERVSYKVESQPVARIEGIAHLVQVVVNHLTTTPGSDVLNETRGGGLVDLARRYRTEEQELKQRIQDRIETTEQKIKQEQSQIELPETEQLDSLNLIEISIDEDNPTIMDIEVGVRSVAKQTARLAI